MTKSTETPWIKTASRNKGRGISSRSINSSLIQYAEKDIPTAEVLAANTTPVEIIPAPGAGYVIEFISAVMILDYNTAAYAASRTCHFEYASGGTTVSDTVAAAAFTNQSDDCIEVCQALSAEVELTANSGIYWALDTGDETTGDSPVRIKVAYRVHATGL